MRSLASLARDDRGQLGSTKTVAKVGVSFVIALAVTGLLTAFLLPVATSEVVDSEQQSITQDVGEVVNVTPYVDSTLDATNATADNATYTLNHTDGASETNSIANGSEATFTLEGDDYTVNVSDVNANSATATFTYETDSGWSAGAQGLWNILDILLILPVFLVTLAIALAGLEKFG